MEFDKLYPQLPRQVFGCNISMVSGAAQDLRKNSMHSVETFVQVKVRVLYATRCTDMIPNARQSTMRKLFSMGILSTN